MIRVRFFARLREDLGTAELEVPYSNAVKTVAGLRRFLYARESGWGDVLAADNILCAVNREQVNPDRALADGDEVAFFPPVTGG